MIFDSLNNACLEIILSLTVLAYIQCICSTRSDWTHNRLSRMDNNTGNFTSVMDNNTGNPISILKEESSIQTVLSVIFAVVIVLGIIGNTCTILVIKFKKDFQNATFTTISLLAFVDVVALCVRGILVVNFFLHYNWITDPVLFRVVFIVTFLTYACSCGNVVILARLRYKLLAFPIEGMKITSRNMIYQCLAVWIISIIIAVPYGFHMFLSLKMQGTRFTGIIETIVGILMLICTIVPIIVFHVIKIQKLKDNITRRRNTIRRMTKMIAVVCLVQIITVTQASVAIGYLTFADYSPTSDTVRSITQLLVILGHAINPVLFFYFNSCKRILMIFLPRKIVKAHSTISNIEERRI